MKQLAWAAWFKEPEDVVNAHMQMVLDDPAFEPAMHDPREEKNKRPVRAGFRSQIWHSLERLF